jgi:predicted Rossmann-fold nucleotide-binding protein
MSKKLVSVIVAAAMAASLSAPAFAMGVDTSVQAQVKQSSSVDKVGCFRKWNGNVVCGGGGGGWGGAAAAGVFGLATGAIIGGAIASSQAQAQANANAQAAAQQQQNQAQYQQWVSYCQSKYRSFDIQSGTYLGSDGARHACQ